MKKIRYLLEAVFIHLLFGFFKIMPAAGASNTGGWLGRFIGPKLGASRKALKNLHLALPGKTGGEYQAIINGMWENLGRVIAEYPHLQTIAQNHVTVEGLEIFDTLPADKPCLFFAAHLGNWEIVPPTILSRRNIPIHLVYRAPNNPYVAALLDHCRVFADKVVTIPKSRKGARDIVRALSDGDHVGILIDQKYNEGIPAPFFGKPAMTSPAFVQLAQKFDCPLIPVQVRRTGGAHFTLTLHPPLPVQSRAVEDVIADAHRLIEGWILAAPEQWLWLHRRWDSAAVTDL